MRHRRHNRTAGFSLIEVVVGIAVLGLVSAPVCASLLLSVRMNTHAQMLMSARLQASAVAETLLAEGIDVTETVGEDETLVWGEKQDGGEGQEGYWTRELDGVAVTVAEMREDDNVQPCYAVTITGSAGAEGKEETVVLETIVRAVEPIPEQEGGGE